MSGKKDTVSVRRADSPGMENPSRINMRGKDGHVAKTLAVSAEALGTLYGLHTQMKGVERKLEKLTQILGVEKLIKDGVTIGSTHEEKHDGDHHEDGRGRTKHRHRSPSPLHQSMVPRSGMSGHIDLAPCILILCGLPGSGKVDTFGSLYPWHTCPLTMHHFRSKR